MLKKLLMGLVFILVVSFLGLTIYIGLATAYGRVWGQSPPTGRRMESPLLQSHIINLP